MLKPNSYTREDVVEINCHAGRVAAGEILSLALKNGARLAEPGEFTKRAFLNGRIDLTQAEAVIDIINSKSAGALKAAAAHLKGGLRKYATDVKKTLADLLARIELSIDFPEHDDERLFPEEIFSVFENDAIKKLSGILEKYENARLIRDGIVVAVAGKPNVGKSSLVNALLEYERAIVTSEPGTTRDYISERIMIQGIHATIIDTAGLRDSSDLVERAGMKKTRERIAEADIVLFMVDAFEGMTEDDYAVYDMFKTKKMILVVIKTDRKGGELFIDKKKLSESIEKSYVSALRGDGLDELKAAVAEQVGGAEGFNFDGEIGLNLRQKTAVEKALERAEAALALLADGNFPELAAIETNNALEQIDKLLGVTESGDILDSIFGTFCVGK